jgi:hypothetical protein
MRCAVLGVEVAAVAAWIVHELAPADVDASGVERVVVVAAAFVVGVVGVAGCAAAVGAVGVVVRCLVSNVVVAGVVVIAGNLCLLWPRGRAFIALTCASDFFWLCAVLRFGFCGFGRFGRCGGD